MLKQNFIKTMLLLCALIAGGSAWADDYVLVTSASDLVVGGEYLIVNTAGTYAAGATSTTSTKYATTVSVTVSDGKISNPSSNVAVYTLGGSAGSWTFYSSKDLKYLYWTSGNSLNVNATVSDNTRWAIAFSDGQATITNKNTTSRVIRFNSDRFACYTSNTGTLVNLYKKQTTPKYALTISEPTGGTITVLDDEENEVSSGDKFEKDTELTLEAVASVGYTFSIWTKTAGTFGNAATKADNTFTMPAEAATIGATFTKNSYDLTLLKTNGSLAVTVDGADWDGSSKIPYNAEVEITATPNDGYVFVKWTSDDIGEYDELTNPLTFNMPAGNVEIDASFESSTLYKTIIVDVDVTGGTISADKVSAKENDVVTLTATPDDGYTFTSWTVKDADNNTITVTDNRFSMPSTNVTVTAIFTAIAVTNVSLDKTSATIGVGETVTLTANVTPDNALNKAVTWTSDNISVATVSNGVVTAVAAGNATITVRTTDGSHTATCAVTVVNAVTFDATSDTGVGSLSKNGVTFTCNSGVLNNGSEYRLYKNSMTTFSVTTGKITKIEFTGVSGNPASGFASQDGWTTSSNDGTWTGTATSVSFTASGAQVRATKIKVYIATTATPTFSVETGEYSEAKDVNISCDTDGANIYYTTNGDIPTSSSTPYSSAVHITETTTLKAIAIKDGVDSDVASATYTMNRPAAPTFDVAEGFFGSAFTLHLATETDGAVIYYTTDGSTPNGESTPYSTGVSIPASTTTVKAIAVKNGLTSNVATAIYTYDTRPVPTFTLSSTSVDLKVNETSSAISLNTNSDGAITFSCDDAHVTLTGSGDSRTISANAVGEYTVNVSTAATSNFLAGAGTIMVNVTKKTTTMVLIPTFSSKDLYVTTSGSLTGVPQYNSSDIVGAEITYSSSDETVATINASTGAVTFKKAGSTTLTASYAGTNEYEKCEETYVLDLVDTTPQSTEVDITFGNALYGTSYSGGDAADKGPFEGTVNKVTVTVTQGSGQYLYVNNDETRIYGGATKGTITITAPTGYVMTKIEITKGEKWDITASPGTLSTATWTGEASSVVFSAGSRSDFRSAKVTLAPSVTLNTYGYATYCSEHPIDFSKAVGFTAWRVSNVAADGTITFNKITETIKGGQGVLLYNKDAGGNKTTFTLTIGENEGAAEFTNSENKLVGTTVATYLTTVVGDYTNFGLSGNEFKKIYTGIIPVNKAYLPVLTTVVDALSASGARMSFMFVDESTGISSMKNDECFMHNEVYDLQGRRVAQPTKGLYIINGKKTVIK